MIRIYAQSVLRLHQGLRVLEPSDLPRVRELLAQDPLHNVFVDYRAALTRLDQRWLGGQMWGWYVDGDLVSVCHSAANLIPAMGTAQSLAAFAERAATHARHSATLVGPRDQVELMWRDLQHVWAPPSDARWNQPHLAIDHDPLVEPDPMVRVSTSTDLQRLFPACVAMYTEEVGSPPNDGGGLSSYRMRVGQLIDRGWSLARYDADGNVEFKAEIACATTYACQVQGVWVRPDLRGRGLAAAGIAAVVAYARARIAPSITLYVNDYNIPARRAYETAGFRQTGTFSTLLF